MARASRKKVLILDDDKLFARSLLRVLEQKYEVTTVVKIAEAMEVLAKDPPDVILLDMMLRGESGLDFLAQIKERTSEFAIIALTAVDRLANVVKAMRSGASNYLTKPVSFDELILAIENALETSAIRGEVIRRRDLQKEANRERMAPFWEALAAANSGLLFVDGWRFPYHQLLAEIDRRRIEMPPLVGSLASQPYLQPSGDGARVFVDSEIHEAACVAVGLHGVSMELHTVRSFDAASPVYTVSRAAGDVLYEVDGEPATHWYRRFFTVDGELLALPESAYAFPLMLDGAEASRRQIYRCMMDFNDDDGSVRFHGDIQTGDRIRLAVRGEGSPIPVAEAAIDKRPQAAISISSFGRHLAFSESHMDSETEAVFMALDEMPIAGPVGFGEIASDVGDGATILNHVTVLAFLRETTS